MLKRRQQTTGWRARDPRRGFGARFAYMKCRPSPAGEFGQLRVSDTPNGAVARGHSDSEAACRVAVVLPKSGAGRLSARSSTRLRRTDPSAPAVGEARGHGLPIRAAVY